MEIPVRGLCPEHRVPGVPLPSPGSAQQPALPRAAAGGHRRPPKRTGQALGSRSAPGGSTLLPAPGPGPPGQRGPRPVPRPLLRPRWGGDPHVLYIQAPGFPGTRPWWSARELGGRGGAGRAPPSPPVPLRATPALAQRERLVTVRVTLGTARQRLLPLCWPEGPCSQRPGQTPPARCAAAAPAGKGQSGYKREGMGRGCPAVVPQPLVLHSGAGDPVSGCHRARAFPAGGSPSLPGSWGWGAMLRGVSRETGLHTR